MLGKVPQVSDVPTQERPPLRRQRVDGGREHLSFRGALKHASPALYRHENGVEVVPDLKGVPEHEEVVCGSCLSGRQQLEAALRAFPRRPSDPPDFSGMEQALHEDQVETLKSFVVGGKPGDERNPCGFVTQR